VAAVAASNYDVSGKAFSEAGPCVDMNQMRRSPVLNYFAGRKREDVNHVT
jgi:hypothetical protein